MPMVSNSQEQENWNLSSEYLPPKLKYDFIYYGLLSFIMVVLSHILTWLLPFIGFLYLYDGIVFIYII